MHFGCPVCPRIHIEFCRIKALPWFTPTNEVRRFVNVKASNTYAIIFAPCSIHIVSSVFKYNKWVTNMDVVIFHITDTYLSSLIDWLTFYPYMHQSQNIGYPAFSCASKSSSQSATISSVESSAPVCGSIIAA